MASHWPPFDLRIRTPRLELRHVTEADLPALIAVAEAGIHDPADMPFQEPWTDRTGPEFAWEFHRWHWRSLAATGAGEWHLTFAAFPREGGEPLGIQAMEASDFPARRTFLTGSWLGQAHQGRGLGKEMRAAVLHLGFDSLGAQAATSASFVGNEASERVSRALGYEENGRDWAAPRGERREQVRWLLPRARWEQLRGEGRYPEVSLEGVEGTLALLGLTP